MDILLQFINLIPHARGESIEFVLNIIRLNPIYVHFCWGLKTSKLTDIGIGSTSFEELHH